MHETTIKIINLTVKDTYLVTLHHNLNFPLLAFSYVRRKINQPNANYIFNTYLYHTFATSFSVPCTIIRENFCILHPKPSALTKLLYAVHWLGH